MKQEDCRKLWRLLEKDFGNESSALDRIVGGIDGRIDRLSDVWCCHVRHWWLFNRYMRNGELWFMRHRRLRWM